VLDDGGDGDKIQPGAHATAGREEPGRSTVAGELHGLAALLPSARNDRQRAAAFLASAIGQCSGLDVHTFAWFLSFGCPKR
jgi:hypothetical protein